MPPSKTKALELCAGCSNSLTKKEHLRCSICTLAFDLVCLNMSKERYRSFYAANVENKNAWKCPECRSKMPKTGNINTPVRGTSPTATGDKTMASTSPTQDNVTMRVKKPSSAGYEDLVKRLSDEQEDSISPIACIRIFTEEMRAMREEVSRFSDRIAGLTTAIKTQGTRLDDLEARIDALESNSIKNDSCKIESLQETISQLRLEIHDRDQDMLGNDIEIASFPEVRNENLTHTLLTVAKKLGVDLEERDVVNAQRIGPEPSSGEGSAEPRRPRPMVVRLARRASRDALLQAARTRRGVTTEGLLTSVTHRPFYVNERLTKTNRQLFQKTREAAKRSDWRYVWTRDGKIYTRKEQGRPRTRVRSEEDLARVFGVTDVSH